MGTAVLETTDTGFRVIRKDGSWVATLTPAGADMYQVIVVNADGSVRDELIVACQDVWDMTITKDGELRFEA